MKKLIKKFKELSGIKKIILLMLFFLMPMMIGQAGFVGYYEMKNPAIYDTKVVFGRANYGETNIDNISTIKIKDTQEPLLEMSRNCDYFTVAGIITPFTPPIPLFWLRSWHWGDSDCNYFTISTKPQSDSVRLITNNQTFEPEVSEGLYGYTKYKFPIKAKNIDSGIIIIEKDGEKIEIPFKYEYFKFWY